MRNSWGDTEILMQNDKLYYVYLSDPDPSLTMIRLVPETENIFRLDGRDTSSPIGEQVIFEFDQNDRVEKVKIGDTYTFPHVK